MTEPSGKRCTRVSMLISRRASAPLPSSLVCCTAKLVLRDHHFVHRPIGRARCRKEERKDSTLPGSALAADMTTVRYHNLLRQGKAQPAAPLFSGVEQVEDPLLLFRVHSDALVR